ncbi:MAG: bifunctional proline dehydrogenase/L-glutamate gamma-semialdehyde dehydrogenase PutA [Gammaproteobacteria bacterium]|nr:bifunctional proline dehydrogenase/L-glutamate gamma-semialdehyde dehydrogenase PutA [Gammaproteobacteria bacterium]
MTAEYTDGTVQAIDRITYSDENQLLKELVDLAGLSEAERQRICAHAARLIHGIRQQSAPGLMEVFLAEYGLSTDEGIALMCLAEALLRVPDAETIDALIEDKIAPSNWAEHMGRSTSPLVNASTWALMLTGKVLQDHPPGPVGHLRGAIKRLGEPVIRSAVNQAMKEMGRQFVLGETIAAAMSRAHGMEETGYSYSYDMLGEAARTNADAESHYLAYSQAIAAIATSFEGDDVNANPGISVKLSALFPRYELAQRKRVLTELVPRLNSLALLAKSANMGINIDAEEANRQTLSLEVIERVLSEPTLAGWDGFGVVVQAYGQRAGHVIEWLFDLTEKLNRRITVRLVKGAYWDSEIKQAQYKGMSGFPVFTSKAATDISYIANAKRLLGMTDRIFPQFATHNAHSAAAILHMAPDKERFEFQRLHGMGEPLYALLKTQEKCRCRIYAPVGEHRDLLAYLVRRLLENGANSSFVNQVVDEDVSPETIAADPFSQLPIVSGRAISPGTELFKPERRNSHGWDLDHYPTLDEIDIAREPFHRSHWTATPLIATQLEYQGESIDLYNPALPEERLGRVQLATEFEVDAALTAAQVWEATAEERTVVLNRIADLYETHFGEMFALLAREAGKTLPDAVAELREAVDFLRYYAAGAVVGEPVGIFACISPWNFPLAIFTGQVAAALAAGNGVLAKPAEQTPLVAWRAIQLMHEAGVPHGTVQLLPGDGSTGAMLTGDPRIDGVAFTGSTETARIIRRSMAQHLTPGAPLIAETGGLNAMIVDSTALPEQAVEAVMESAFQSAGQRCSALRCLYVQEDIAKAFKTMLFGAMNELSLGDPWHLSTDSGPIIDREALSVIEAYIDKAEKENRLLKRLTSPKVGVFSGPAVIQVDGIEDLKREVFGPVLHLAIFSADRIDKVIDAINRTGYGLTFGLQTRIDDRVQAVCERINAGNIYVNRNQIGAIVGSQPFGGNGLSGTGPKAGGANYLERFYRAPATVSHDLDTNTSSGSTAELQGLIKATGYCQRLGAINLPGPTGESNSLSRVAREPLLCLGPGERVAAEQAGIIREMGGTAVECGGSLAVKALKEVSGFSGVVWWGDKVRARELDLVLSENEGPLLPLITGKPDSGHVFSERHVCVDTTASGGNTELLSSTTGSG